ncbi:MULTISPECIES: helix-turn-helix domain-containing protein [Streptomyces]|uniref:helix-turn-helix domain-containing protein n=1 Tax=Streptomyces TaxID=1883 RepID=UPI00163D2395|nr:MULTISPECIES: helix-turn-helix transcriptional regulator [Streptomyces]MBC2873791.1 helix-turn-helix transcriptional regulator [Streptomyces sp. TYQ1024]UBI37786.1 helix-turn-helix domain-containing protein [Streptomyces mobaraensis]UKW30374.1 helix-turn-helix domain-containing protein [Streptomyces sp. TYQ1024]
MLTKPPSDLGPVIKAARRVRGWTQKNLADQLNQASGWGTCTPNDVYRWETGRRTPNEWLPYLAAVLELDLSPHQGTMTPTGTAPVSAPVIAEDDPVKRRALFLAAAALAVLPSSRGQRVVEALNVVSQGDSPRVLADSLNELINHYSSTICSAPSDVAYDEVFAVRSYANAILKASPVSERKDISLSIGWLSCLLGIAACDSGAHAAAQVWCADAEHRSAEAGHPELAGWAVLTRSMIAFYQGQSQQAFLLASKGRHATSVGTVVHAKLAAQEMRAAAMAGDTSRVEKARRNAAQAIACLSRDIQQAGAFSIAPGEEPPYTATSLMLLGRFKEAVAATKRVLQTCYQPEAQPRGGHAPGYARALLILALAHAGNGDLDEAVAAGHAALAGKRTAWPTLTLAGKLDQALERNFSTAQQVQHYRARYLEASHRLLAPYEE